MESGQDIKMAKSTYMRADRELLEELKECKIAKRESYAEVIKRIMKNNAFVQERLKMKLRKIK